MSSVPPPADFTALLMASQRKLLGYIMSLVPRLVDAEDILQNTNATLLRKYEEFAEVENFSAWACRFAYYEVLNFRKRAARDRRVFAADEELLEQLASEALERFHHQDELLQAVEQCEQALRPRDRELLQARYQGDRSIDQLSQTTGRTAAAIRQTLSRIRGALLTCIQRRLASQEGRS